MKKFLLAAILLLFTFPVFSETLFISNAQVAPGLQTVTAKACYLLKMTNLHWGDTTSVHFFTAATETTIGEGDGVKYAGWSLTPSANVATPTFWDFCGYTDAWFGKKIEAPFFPTGIFVSCTADVVIIFDLFFP